MNIKGMTSGDLIELLEEIKRELEIRKEGAEKYAQEQREKERLIISARTAEIIKKIRGIIRNVSQEGRARPDIFVNDRKGGKMVKVQFPFHSERDTLNLLNKIKASVETLERVEKVEIYESNRYGFGVIWSLKIRI